MSAPLISVVVPVYNHAGYLRGCFDSVLDQRGGPSTELVIVDDASPDPAVATLLDDYADRPGVTVLRRDTNRGISQTQSEGIHAARGQYVAYLDCDDQLAPGALSRVADALGGAPGTDYLFTDRADISETGKTLRVARFGGYPHIPPDTPIGDALLDGMVASHLKCIRTSLAREHDRPDTPYSGVQDWELALSLLRAGADFLYLPEPLYRHRIHGGSVTSSLRQQQFHKSAELQRMALLHRFRSALAKPGLDASASETGAQMFWIEGIAGHGDLVRLKAAWGRGESCGFRSASLLDLPTRDFLAVYNAYFDRIDLADPRDPFRLMGHLWDPRILVETRRGGLGNHNSAPAVANSPA